MPSSSLLFHFRQRAGKLDWKQISSLTVDNILIKGHIEDLQYVLDQVAFSEFTPMDVRNNSIDQVAKLVQIMQLIIEYLLHHQELNFQQIRSLTQKNNDLKAQRKKLKNEHMKFGDDIKTYQRQLQILRQSLHSAGLTHPAPAYPYPAPAMKVLDPHNKADKDEGRSENLLMALMEHEQNARKQMLQMLDEQRQAFTQEMGTLVTTLQSTFIHNIPKENDAASLFKHIFPAIEALKASYEQQNGKLLQSVQTLLNTHNNNNNNNMMRSSSQYTPLPPNPIPAIPKKVSIEENNNLLILQQAALETKERELLLREKTLSERVKRAEKMFQQMQKEYEKNNEEQEDRKGRGVRLMNSVMRGVMRHRVQYKFLVWRLKTVLSRPSPSFESSPLADQLQRERQQVLTLQSKLSTLSNELERLSLQEGERQKMEREKGAEARGEREKYLILQAKYNALLGKVERERVERIEEERMREVEREELKPVERKRESISVMTSANFAPSSFYAPPSYLSPQASSRPISSAPPYYPKVEKALLEEDEEALLRKAMERIGERRQGLERIALVSLAEELSSKLPL